MTDRGWLRILTAIIVGLILFTIGYVSLS